MSPREAFDDKKVKKLVQNVSESGSRRQKGEEISSKCLRERFSKTKSAQLLYEMSLRPILTDKTWKKTIRNVFEDLPHLTYKIL